MPMLPERSDPRAAAGVARRPGMPAPAGAARRPGMPAPAGAARRPGMPAQAEQGVMRRPTPEEQMGAAPAMKKGGKVKKYAKGGAIDGCAKKGKTKGKMY